MSQITTYHCLCTQLLLATPYPLRTLPQRQTPSLDHARILPLGEPPISHTALRDENDTITHLEALAVDNERATSTGDGGSGVETVGRGVGSGVSIEGRGAGREGSGEVQYSLLLNTTLDRRPVIVRREDGFEKRWVRRCGRCRTGVGYVLEEKGEVVYLLEEGFVETEGLRVGQGGGKGR
ncbi:hypothetical protein MMC30_007622 [Trapelia coarctata]|nr:hypothetical protein [Trapelia coarctata]